MCQQPTLLAMNPIYFIAVEYLYRDQESLTKMHQCPHFVDINFKVMFIQHSMRDQIKFKTTLNG